MALIKLPNPLDKFISVRGYREACNVVFKRRDIEYMKVFEKHIRIVLLSGRFFDVDREHYENRDKTDVI